MTYKTLSYIHNLLVNAEQSASLKVKWQYETFCEKRDLYDDRLINKGEFESCEREREQLLEERRLASEALEEFENQDWR